MSHTSQLVDLEAIIPNVKFDIRYATPNNFVGETVYSHAKAFMVAEAAQALRNAALQFAQEGFGILVWDAYRPLSVTKIFWERTPQHLQSFLGDPNAGGSPHNRGCAVDMTLYELSTGEPLEMPSDFDEFTDRAKMDHIPLSEQALINRRVLLHVMEGCGFSVRPDEWWHYNLNGYENYPVLDVPLAEL